ncbi:Cue3p Ecym_2272 [Eremothecium cymbalariae DBVPG|uniref:CUE domain-containing protein n=1 Tax=Eremothecium cymbalariae (strain CBS 270.75 / DBVPG 7215 / KCTC 17166 / NRRL Y-17582) TaxID=931890 RepID=G8JPR3_ERECY|nr:Hypothetical protein Ecym_2272 [Eremothecium cymbalariae DBVPG\
MSYMRRVLEFNGEDKLSFPIVKFPPFALRAALVEKDPLVWLHFLETYVSYVQYLMADNRLDKLDESTNEKLVIFTGSYLHEIADEEGKLLSLGMNAEVSRQLGLLKLWMFALIKKCGLLHLQIFSGIMWDFVKIYVRVYPDTTRSLIDGSLKPEVNTQKANLNRIFQVQQHLRQLIEANKFSRTDLMALEDLLSADGRLRFSFADKFLSKQWAEMLESLYGKGPDGYLADWGKRLGILTYLSVSEDRLSEFFKQLGIDSFEKLSLYPLFGSLLVSDNFKKRLPGIYNRIPFLKLIDSCNGYEGPTQDNPVAAEEIKQADLDTASELFPHLTQYQIKQLLLRNGNNLEVVINMLFENPQLADDIQLEEPNPIKQQNRLVSTIISTKYKSELKPSDRILKVKQEHEMQVPDEVRNRTLTRALELLYSDDGDERDDTYDDAEVLRASADRVDLDKKEESVLNYDRIEAFLWDMLIQDKLLFTRQQRGSAKRKAMKKETSWSDEQIEGWARMLERSPLRVQVLEEKYMFRGNVRAGKKSYIKNEETKPPPKFPPNRVAVSGRNSNESKTHSNQQQNQSSKGSKRSRIANHNRKAARGKKFSHADAP